MSLGTHRCEQAAAQLLGCNFTLGGGFSTIFSVHFGIFCHLWI